MKKIFQTGMTSLLILLSITTVCYAGDVPEGLLSDDSSQVYFGEIENVDGESITVIQRQNIKGEFTKDSEITYVDFGFTESPEIGKQYLCGFLNDSNPLYIWEVTGFDTDTLEIKNTDDMSQRMQEYLNGGQFEEKEQERLSTIANAHASISPVENNTTVPQMDTEDQPLTTMPTKSEDSIPVLVCIFGGIIVIGLAVLVWKKRKH